ncbi:MAG: hypothetical protein ABH885_08270 [Candidatus Omnitrophota bacterium]
MTKRFFASFIGNLWKPILLMLLYSVFIMLLVFPFARLIISGDKDVILAKYSDVSGTLWYNWWFNFAQANNLNLFYTDYLCFPKGISVWLISGNLLIIFIFLPLYKLFGIAQGYNITAFLILLANCIAGFLLALRITEKKPAAFIGGLLFGINPYTLFELINGRMEQLAIFWIALFYWALLKMRASPKLGNVFLSAFFFACTFLSLWHYGIILLFALMLWMTGAVLRKDYAHFRVCVFMTVLGCAAFLPYGLGFSALMASQYDFSFTDLDFYGKYVDFFKIMTAASTVKPISYLPGYFSAVLSLITLGICAIIAIINRKIRYGAYWAVMGFLAVIFSMGPVYEVYSQGNLITYHLPFYYFVKYVPFMGRFFWPWRFLALFYLSASVIIASGISRISEIRAYAGRVLLVAVVALIMFLEFFLYIYPKWPSLNMPYKIPSIYYELAKLPDGAVLELPFSQSNYYVYYQAIHHKKLMNSMISGTNELNPSPVRDYYLRFDLSKHGYFMRNAVDVEFLRKSGLRYVVFNENEALRLLYGDRMLVGRIKDNLDALLGSPIITIPSENMSLYILRDFQESSGNGGGNIKPEQI